MKKSWDDVDKIIQLKLDGKPLTLKSLESYIATKDIANTTLLTNALKGIDKRFTADVYPYARIKLTTKTLIERFIEWFEEGDLSSRIFNKAKEMESTKDEDNEELKKILDEKLKKMEHAKKAIAKEKREEIKEKKIKKTKKELEEAGITLTDVPSDERVGHKKSKYSNIPTREMIKFEVLDSNNSYENFIPDEDDLYEFPEWTTEFVSLLDNGMNVWLYGGTGAGKTSLAEQVCAIGKIPLIYQSFHEDIKPDSLFGNFRLEDGNTIWQDGPVTKAYREGLVLLLDEIDGTPPEILFCLYAILDRKPLVLTDNGCEVIKPHKNFRIIATGNTLGRGDDDGSYSGTNVLNRAFLNRFRIWYKVDYPSEKVYKSIIMKEGVTESVASVVARLAREINTAAMNGTLTETFSLRDARDISKAAEILNGNVMRALQLSLLNRLPTAEQAAINDVYKRIIPTK